MNAGAFGSEIWQYVVSVKTMSYSGEIKDRKPSDFEITYRSTIHKNSNEFFVSAVFVDVFYLVRVTEGNAHKLSLSAPLACEARAPRAGALRARPCAPRARFARKWRRK